MCHIDVAYVIQITEHKTEQKKINNSYLLNSDLNNDIKHEVMLVVQTYAFTLSTILKV